MKVSCPCCGSERTLLICEPQLHHLCQRCGHRWRIQQTSPDYTRLSGRNDAPATQLERKYADRLSDITPLLKDGFRILEVGCAEGELGNRVKAFAAVHYTGIEISRDAQKAERVLDRVTPLPAAALQAAAFDILLSFHVLEHIPDVAEEAAQWARLLAASGAMLVEVPNGAGHPMRVWDTHPEHLHFFTPASLSALLTHAGLEVISMRSGHYESPIYPDSLRVLARPMKNDAQKKLDLVEQFRRRLDGDFAIYGIGGDFRNCILPVLDKLPVVALLDSSASRKGEQVGAKLRIESFDVSRHGGYPILIASMSFKQEICEQLQAASLHPLHLIGLDEVIDPQ